MRRDNVFGDLALEKKSFPKSINTELEKMKNTGEDHIINHDPKEYTEKIIKDLEEHGFDDLDVI
jgi:hypothetical protein